MATPSSPSAAFATLLYSKTAGGVAHLSLNRLRRRNAYSVQMRDDFAAALSAVADDAEARALLITGEGPAFCAGADLSEFGTAPSQDAARRTRWQRDVWGQLIGLDKPIVVAVHGYCIGSGVEIMLLGDVRIAASGTILAMPETRLGLIPAAGGTQTLPRNAGPSNAMDLLLTGRRFGADDALRWGLVSRVVAPDALLPAALDAAGRLARIPPLVSAAARIALRQGLDLPLAAALRRERMLAAILLDGDGDGNGLDGREDAAATAAPSAIITA